MNNQYQLMTIVSFLILGVAFMVAIANAEEVIIDDPVVIIDTEKEIVTRESGAVEPLTAENVFTPETLEALHQLPIFYD